ncbi:hypothetical protein PLICRDRAFT_45859 [Plicaturopsis crispa FD-325 SS-3]|uniref:SH3 domain-containing protein n=1 Tax=Plicaturopsis crispa FD-325 SS-3 TaxID=944288 RepID=A0A0C9T8H2_PLICR|nr:hypothetical protein PLICRDRAFT_45859 [Plicaturopsis crispa FD-325 SS-3]
MSSSHTTAANSPPAERTYSLQPRQSEEVQELASTSAVKPPSQLGTPTDNDPSLSQETPTLRTDFDRQTTPTARPASTASSALPTPQCASLTSTRPAPPSPAPSRAPSRRVSAAPSTSHTPSQPRAIHIRDFGYPPSDERHRGLGPLVPKRNRHAHHRPDSMSSSGSSASGGPWDDDEDDDGGGEADGYISRCDALADSPLDDADEQALELERGVYHALYAFEPEGAEEMRLTEGQTVEVIGRSGIGWAIALREDGSHALVPESYLELVRSGRDNDDSDSE